MAQVIVAQGEELHAPPLSPLAAARRRIGLVLHRFPGLRLLLALGPPVLWMAVIYLGALGLLFITAFWRQDPVTSAIVQDWNLDNFRFLLQESVYRSIAFRTVGIALAVRYTEAILAFPIADSPRGVHVGGVRTLLPLRFTYASCAVYLSNHMARRTY